MKIRHIPSIHQRRKKRVAAYCRVSTDMKSQEESFETQVSYYQSYIERNDEWVLVGIYADGGVSATGAAKRPEFMRMIADAMEGKIDLILVKSISRFSRNVVDCQVYVQQLRSKGVEVRFEKERLSSLDASSEMIFSMMAAIAQDESRSISQNIRWGYEKRFAQRRAFKSGRSACLRKCVSGAPEPPAADFLSKYSKGEMESAAFFVISAGET